MFTSFLYALRGNGLPVGPPEWLGFLDALKRGVIGSPGELHTIGRALLCRTEADFDRYDVAFAETFQGAMLEPEVRDRLAEWLRKAREAAGPRVDPSIVRFDAAIEPLVRLLEQTPRERLFEQVAARMIKGLTYKETLAALLLAGIRNVQPRPSVGFKFHAVLVVHSAHLVALASPEADRWLPIFWALDQFKRSQATDVRDGDWTMGAVDPKALPSTMSAARAFTTAMDDWDESRADAAAAALARGLKPGEVFELFARYAARDFRSIGHKAIYVANAWRTLETIGWQYSEPVLRSLAYALLAREGSDPVKGDASADRPWRHNQPLVARVRPDWGSGHADTGATTELLAVLRRRKIRACQNPRCDDAFVLHRRKAAGVNSLSDQRNRHAQFERVDARPFAGAFLPGGVQNLVHHRRAVFIILGENLARYLDQVAV